MDDLFQTIEARIRAFIKKNQQNTEHLQQEKERLQAIQKNIAEQIENMVKRLKSIEKMS